MITATQRKRLKEEWLNWHDLRYIKSIELKEKTKKVLSVNLWKWLYVDKYWKLQNI